MFRLILTLLIVGALLGGGYWSWKDLPQVRQFVERFHPTKTVRTLEARFTPEQIMERHRLQLLGAQEGEYRYLPPALEFFPYLLMEVKYIDPRRGTREGVILWGQEDGEMVLDAATWERSHGFEDCINSKTSREEFRVLNTLAQHGNAMPREELAAALHADQELVDTWLEQCRRKKLVVLDKGLYRLHFENPRLRIFPETHLNRPLVTKPYRGAERIKKKYSRREIQKLTGLIFGKDFTIRDQTTVWLPVYRITVLNPDGSQLTTHWNALNGQKMRHALY